MQANIWLTPPILFSVILLIGAIAFFVCGKIAVKGKHHAGKREPYACGEDIKMISEKLPYHAFFRLALLFGILHMVVLVITTHPATNPVPVIAAIYIFSAFISMLILLERKDDA